jgi:hypothetical protein
MLLLLTTEKTRVPPRLRRGDPLFLRSYNPVDSVYLDIKMSSI